MLIETILAVSINFGFHVTMTETKQPATLHKVKGEYVLELSKDFVSNIDMDGLLFTLYHEQAHIDLGHFDAVKAGTPLYDVEVEADRVALAKLKERLVCPSNAIKTVVQYRGWFDSTHPSRFTLSNMAKDF